MPAVPRQAVDQRPPNSSPRLRQPAGIASVIAVAIGHLGRQPVNVLALVSGCGHPPYLSGAGEDNDEGVRPLRSWGHSLTNVQ